MRLPLSLTPFALPRSSTHGSPSISLNDAWRRDTFLSSTRMSALSSRPITTAVSPIGTSRTSPFGARTMMNTRGDPEANAYSTPGEELLLEDLGVELFAAVDEVLHEARLV